MKYQLKDIAEYAKVSVSTVCRVINNNDVVKADTRERVLDAIEALDYRVDNIFARSQTVANYSIGIFLREDDYKKTSEMKFGIDKRTETIAFKEQIESFGGKVELYEMDEILHIDPTELLGKDKIDGVIIFGAGDEDKKLLLHLQAAGIPFIVTNGISDFVRENKMSFVEYDDSAGISEIIKYFNKKDRKHLAMINGPDQMWVCQERRNAFYHYIKEYKIADEPEFYFSGEFDFKTGQDGVRSLAEKGLLDRINGIICGSDVIAIGVISEIINLGKKIPEEIALFGYDDTPICEYFNPPISSIKRDLKHYSSYIVERLYDLVRTENKLHIQIYIKTYPIFRKSS